MDIFSAAKRLSKPFIFKDEGDISKLGIGAHGVIGDGNTCALVRADGCIDWLCLPRFDSPATFGSLLDDERGGETFVRPASVPFETLQRYDPDTNVLETLFRVPEQGVLRVVDYMPWSNDPRDAIHEVHRRVQCLQGEVDLHIVFNPRFNFSRGQTQIDICQNGVLAKGEHGEHLAAVTNPQESWRPRANGRGMEVVTRLRSGERRWLVLSWGAPQPESLLAYRPDEQLRTTRVAWRAWARDLSYEGPWRHHVLRSALVLKLMMYSPTGAMVAAPTTSLPEWLGGSRNWDYRYAWTRDTAMAIRAANAIGYSGEARQFFHFIRNVFDAGHGLRVMYTVDGNLVPEEQELEHLKGFLSSKPVRIGNGAKEQLQLDTAGALLDAAYMYERSGGHLPLRVWRKLKQVIAWVEKEWKSEDDGLWEPRSERDHRVHSKLMCWVAMRRAEELGIRFGEGEQISRWRSTANQIRKNLLQHAYRSEYKRFSSVYKSDVPDASLLLLAVQRFLPPNDPRMLNTIRWVCEQLGEGDYLYRYRAHDGIDEEEGAFVLCGFWLAEALALSGKLEEAQRVFVAHAEASNHLGLLSEEIDPQSGMLLGNFPQAFSHLGLINAAIRIDRALQQREGYSTWSAFRGGQEEE